MFYNTEILTKRGPLARVWMASHLSTKLTKSNLLATSIPTSVSSILGEALLPMALRLSGQLLLGVARIYSRKAKYLLDDCNETLAKVKKAFRPGAVDMEEPGTDGRSRDAITLRAEMGGLEDILNFDTGNWDADFSVAVTAAAAASSKVSKNARANTSAIADITLPDHSLAFGEYDFEHDNYGAAAFDYGENGGIDSQDVGELDLGLDEIFAAEEEVLAAEQGRTKKRARLDDGDDEVESVELGRDGAKSDDHMSARGSIGPLDFDGMDGDLTMDKSGLDLDLGLEGGDPNHLGGMDILDFNFDPVGADYQEERERTPVQNGDLEEYDEQSSLHLTPRTAANLAARKGIASVQASKKIKLTKKLVVDRVTELDWDDGKRMKETLFTEPRYLPNSRLHLRLIELAADSTSFLPQLDSTDPKFELSAPPGLAPELQAWFRFPSRRALIDLQGRKRQKIGETDDNDVPVEIGRRAPSVSRSDVAGMGLSDHENFQGDDVFNRDYGGGGDEQDMGGMQAEDFQFDLDTTAPPAILPGSQQVTPKALKTAKQHTRMNSRTTPVNGNKVVGGDSMSMTGFDDEARMGVSMGPLAVFDDSAVGGTAYNPSTQAHSPSHTMNQATQSLGATEEEEVIAGAAAKGNWSKNTVKAVNVLKSELKPTTGLDGDEKTKVLEFSKVSEKATRRAAASFFFEMLVLSTRDCVKVSQAEAFGEIKVEAKDKLWGIVPEPLVA